MAISKVVFGDDTVIDITDTTATASDVIEGKVVYMSNGVRTVGTADPHFGLPSGGAANEVLTKVSSSDYDIAWQSVPVQSVNGYTGAITLSANDVGALPSDTAIPSNAADVGAIAAPASASTDNVLAYNGSAWVPDKRMVILSYGHSTWAQFLSAYKSNAVIYCRASSNSDPAIGSQTRMAFMAYVSNAENPTNVEFQYYRSVSTHTYAQQGDQVYVYKLTSDGTWSVTVREAYTKIVPGAGLSSSYSNSALTLTNVAAVPTGGTTGQALVKASSSDYALAWQTIDVGHSIPSGGLTGQVLAKSSNADYEVAWSTIHDIPAGGSNGQVLAKSSDSDYAVAWVDQSGDITTELASPSAVPPSSFILSVADGGTGGSTPSAARQNIGAVSAIEVAQASGSGFVLGINEGGTGANNAADALTNLGLSVQAETVNVTYSGVSATLTLKKYGRVVFLTGSLGNGTAFSSATGLDVIGTLPNGYRPINDAYCTVAPRNTGAWASATYYNAIIYLNSENGEIQVRGNANSLKSSTYIPLSIIYICAA